MTGTLEGRIALVTGASRGIGRAIALDLAAKGSSIIVNFKQDESAAAEVVDRCASFGIKAIAVKADLEEPAAIDLMLKRVQEEFGQLDFLIANAAASAFKPLMETQPHNIRRTFALSVDAFLALVQGSVPMMEGRGGGRIVVISGWDTLRVIERHGALAAAKAALETWTRYLACELAEKGINVNSVCPGPIENTLYPHVYGGDEPGYQAWRAVRAAASPKKRLGTPEDVAGVVSFLCSPESEWILGQNIICDGGISLTVPSA